MWLFSILNAVGSFRHLPKEGALLNFRIKALRHLRSRFLTIVMISSLVSVCFTSKALAKEDFAIHPVLGTSAGESFTKALTDLQIEQLFRKPFDSNYFQHEKAERDAAATLCRSLENGYHLRVLDGFTQHHADLTFGFNEIPISLNFEKGKCIRARIAGVSEFPKDSELSGVENAGRYVHPVLDVVEEESFSKPALSDWQMRQLCKDFSYTSHHMEEAGMFRRAELQAAQLFQIQLTGLTQEQVLKKAGSPYSITTVGKVFGDTDNGVQNWIYYLGFANIPIRLTFKNGLAQASFISPKQSTDLRNLYTCLFSRVPCKHVEKELLPFYSAEFRPCNLTKTAIVAMYGEPYTRKRLSKGNEIFEYRLGYHFDGVLLFSGDRCIESKTSYTMGYKRKKTAN